MKTQPEILSPLFQNEIINFFTNHTPAQLSINLRRTVLEYLRYELEAGVIPLYLDEFLGDISNLFELIDTASQEEWIKNSQENKVSMGKEEDLNRNEADGRIAQNDTVQDEDYINSEASKLVKSFFACYKLEDVQEKLWNMMKTALTNEAEQTSVADRSSILSFYEDLEKLIKAIYVL